MMERIIVLGAGGPEVARLVGDIFWSRNPVGRVIGYLDRNYANMAPALGGLPILGGDDLIPEYVAKGCKFINVVSGSTKARYRAAKAALQAGGELLEMVHPSVDLRFKRGIGCYIQSGVFIQAGVVMGDNCAVHLGAILSHEVQLGHSCFVGASHVAGNVTVGDGAFLGIGSVIAPGVSIGKWATVGAGCVVVKDVPDYAVVVGNPGRILKYNEPEYQTGAIR